MNTSDILQRLDGGVYGIDRIKLCEAAAAHIRQMRNAIDDLDNALWKACGDDEQIVRITVLSQGADYEQIQELTR